MARLPGIQQRRRILVSFLKLPRVFEFKIIGGCPKNIRTKGLVIIATDIATDFVIVIVTFTLVALRRRQFHAHVLAQTKVKNTVHVIGVVLLIACTNLAAQLSSRLATSDINNAANCVTAKQGSLWPPKHFHAFYVDTAQQTARIRTDKHSINYDTNSGVEVFFNIGNTHTSDKDCSNPTGPLSGIINDNVR